jgi:hypothetical protein
MKVIISETGEIEELQIIDFKSGVDLSVDLLGNVGIHKDAVIDAVTMDRENFNWWLKYIHGYEATEKDISDLAKEIHEDAGIIRCRVFDYMGQQDMENERDRAVQIIQEIREEFYNTRRSL